MKVGLIDNTTGYESAVTVTLAQRPFKGETIRMVNPASGMPSYYEVTDICHMATGPSGDVIDMYVHVREKA